MKKMRRKISAILLGAMMFASSYTHSFASNVVVNEEFVGVDNSVKLEEGINSEDNLEIKVGMANLTEDGELYHSEEFATIDKLNSDVIKTSTSLSTLYGADRVSTAVKVSQKGWGNGADTVVLVNSKNTMLGIVATPYASLNEAPILITDGTKLDNAVATELSRLSPSRVILIGDRALLSKAVADKVKTVTNAQVDRVFGTTSQEISVNIANKIATQKEVDTAYIVSGTNGVADALTISAKAGSTQNPVIVVDKNSMNQSTSQFLDLNISTAYYIGGSNSISNSLISKVDNVVKNGGFNNRISGSDRHDTNVKVINRFYKDSNLGTVVVTKSDNQGLIDTVCAGPFAAKNSAPILITSKTNIANSTKTLLSSRKANTVYQIGGGISANVSNQIKQKLSSVATNVSDNKSEKPNVNNGTPIEPNNNSSNSNQNSGGEESNQEISIIGTGIKGKTIVIDPGHGGKDPGARGLSNSVEKEWTLITSLACADYLKKAGANVILTRENDVYPTLQDRADISNSNNAVFFCSIHYNKGGNIVNEETGEMSGNGVEVFMGEGYSANTVANRVLNSILSGFNLNNRGVKDGTHLYVIANTVAPAILVEGGFLSSSRDVGILNSEAALKKMGVQIAKGIVSSFENK